MPSSLSGYLSVSTIPGGPCIPVLDNCRTLAYIEQSYNRDRHIAAGELDYTYPDLAWEPGASGSGCAECCSTCMDIECDYTWPGDPANPAPWHDPLQPISDQFFGFIVNTFTITEGYGSVNRASSRLRRRLTCRKRTGTIEGWVVANSCPGTNYGIEWLRATLAGELERPCRNMDIEVHKQTCTCDTGTPREQGWRSMKGVGGFLIEDLGEEPDGRCIPCCEGAYLRITFEVENPRMWTPPAAIGTTTLPVAEDCDCNDEQFYEGCCTDTVESEQTLARRSRPVRALADGTLCPVGWEFPDYQFDTDQLILSSNETKAATAATTGFLLSLKEDPDSGEIIAYDAVTEEIFDPAVVECGQTVTVHEICYTNPKYEPTCLECPGAQRLCAANSGLVVDQQGSIDWVASGIDPDATYTLLDGGVLGPEMQKIQDYWDCIELQGSGQAIGTRSLNNFQELLDDAKQYFIEQGLAPPGPDRIGIRIDTGGTDQTQIRFRNPNSGDFAVNANFEILIDDFPGNGISLSEEDTSDCGTETAVPEFCKQTLCAAPDTSKPLATKVTIATDGTGTVTLDADKIPSGLFSKLVGSYLVDELNCEDCEEGSGTLEISPVITGDSGNVSALTWTPVDWTVREFAAFPPTDSTLRLTDQESRYTGVAQACANDDCGPTGDCGGTQQVPQVQFALNDQDCDDCEPLLIQRFWRFIPPEATHLYSVPVITVRTVSDDDRLPWVKVVSIEGRPTLQDAGVTPDVDYHDGGWVNFEHSILAVAEDVQGDIVVNGCTGQHHVLCRSGNLLPVIHDNCTPVVSGNGLWVGVFLPCGDTTPIEIVVERVAYESS